MKGQRSATKHAALRAELVAEQSRAAALANEVDYLVRKVAALEAAAGAARELFAILAEGIGRPPELTPSLHRWRLAEAAARAVER